MNNELKIEKENDILTITLNRPERRNALSKSMLEKLLEVLLEAYNNPTLRALILTGSEEAFCAGGDVKDMAKEESDTRTLQEKSNNLRRYMETSKLLHTMPAITIAILPGAAAGAGLSLALACDLRIASKNAKLTTAFAKVGFSGDFGGSYYLTQLVGTAKARELYYLAEVLSAEQAKELGIINKVVEQNSLKTQTKDIIEKILESPPIALKYMKKNMNIAEKGDLNISLDNEAIHHTICGQTEDHKNAAIAIKEKVKPIFKGR